MKSLLSVFKKKKETLPSFEELVRPVEEENAIVEALPFLAPETINGYTIRYHYKDAKIIVNWQYGGQYGGTLSGLGLKRGDVLLLRQEPMKPGTFYEHDYPNGDPLNVSVYFGSTCIGRMRDNRLRSMAIEWLNKNRPIFCAASYLGSQTKLYLEFAFYSKPRSK